MKSSDKQKNTDQANIIRTSENSEQKRARLEREHTRFSLLVSSELQNTSKQDNTSLHTLEAKFEAALDQAQLEIERAHFSPPFYYDKQRQMQRNIQKETCHEILNSVEYIQSLLMLCKNEEERKKVYHSKIESLISNATERAKQNLGYNEKES